LAESGPLIQKDAAARLGIDSGDMVAYVDDLLAAGSVDKQRDPADRRRQILEITPAGKRLLAKAERDLDAATEQTFGALSAEERGQLYELLVRVLAQRDPDGWPDAESASQDSAGSGDPERWPEA
jgi:DNA-binding MarR family transcriptional regulator